MLTRSEKLILEHRRWARQFYSDYDDGPGAGRSRRRHVSDRDSDHEPDLEVDR